MVKPPPASNSPFNPKEKTMENLEVRLVRLEPMRVAYSLGFGPSPEGEAWNTLMRAHRFFGFNNPDPSPGSPNYGYEQWMSLSEAVQPGDGVKVKDVPGGLYAVARCRGIEAIFPTWQQLVTWVEASRFQHGYSQCLEECLNPEVLTQALSPSEGEPAYDQLLFDLYLPVTD
jgi:DNA gyrase inhibitor GyrI